MELRVIEKTDEELRIEVAGEDHTFMNVLKGALLETVGVEAATYDVNPEQSGGQTEPILSIKAEEGTDRTMDVVWVLWAVTAVAVGAIVYTVLPPIAESGLLVFGGFFALLLGGYLIWGVYHTIRTHGRKTAEAAMVGAWVLGGLAVLGISVLLVLG